MAMREHGLVKLSEECAEATQVAQKMVAYPELQFTKGVAHPDGTFLRDRLEDELGDVLAAATFVTQKLRLDEERIATRIAYKLKLFYQWDTEP